MATQTELRRAISLPLLTFYGLGTILGAGIYVLVGKVAGVAGMYTPLAFVIAALLAVFTGLSYTELAARYPRSAGQAVYVERGLGVRAVALLVGWLVVAIAIVSGGAIVNGFVGYLAVFANVERGWVITTLVLTLGALAAWGIRESVMAASAITLIEVAGLLLIVIVAAPAVAALPMRFDELVPPVDAHVWQSVLLGAFLAFYAFIGFEDIVTAAEEVRDPSRTLPRAILIAVALSTVLYLSVALVAVFAVTPPELAASDAPLALVYERATGGTPALISAISLFAVVNGALVQIILASRMLYGMSREGWHYAGFGRVHPRTRTPLLSTAAVTVALLLLALWFPLVTLATVASFLVLVLFALMNWSLLRIKRRDPHPAGIRTVPLWVPAAGLVTTAAFVVFQLYQFVRN
jgi:amino acid transporter